MRPACSRTSGCLQHGAKQKGVSGDGKNSRGGGWGGGGGVAHSTVVVYTETMLRLPEPYVMGMKDIINNSKMSTSFSMFKSY